MEGGKGAFASLLHTAMTACEAVSDATGIADSAAHGPLGSSAEEVATRHCTLTCNGEMCSVSRCFTKTTWCTKAHGLNYIPHAFGCLKILAQ